jgi:hypothetical protein
LKEGGGVTTMKIKIVHIGEGEKIVHNKNVVNVGDVIDVPKSSAEIFVARGIAEVVKEAPKKTKIESNE